MRPLRGRTPLLQNVVAFLLGDQPKTLSFLEFLCGRTVIPVATTAHTAVQTSKQKVVFFISSAPNIALQKPWPLATLCVLQSPPVIPRITPPKYKSRIESAPLWSQGTLGIVFFEQGDI